MTTEYLPTTEHVRDAVRPYRVHPLEFDRWLSEELAKAWDKGYAASRSDEYFGRAFVPSRNPHRKADTGDG